MSKFAATLLCSVGLVICCERADACCCKKKTCCAPAPTCCAPAPTCCAPAAPVSDSAAPAPTAAVPADGSQAIAQNGRQTYRSYSYDPSPGAASMTRPTASAPARRSPEWNMFRADQKMKYGR